MPVLEHLVALDIEAEDIAVEENRVVLVPDRHAYEGDVGQRHAPGL
jgi:hypothetical protein